jgi:hypothetical protein
MAADAARIKGIGKAAATAAAPAVLSKVRRDIAAFGMFLSLMLCAPPDSVSFETDALSVIGRQTPSSFQVRGNRPW